MTAAGTSSFSLLPSAARALSPPRQQSMSSPHLLPANTAQKRKEFGNANLGISATTHFSHPKMPVDFDYSDESDDDMGAEERKEQIRSDAPKPKSNAAPSKSSQPVKTGHEGRDFLLPYMNSFKALLAKKSKLKISLDSLKKHKLAGSIPKALQLTDNSLQIPETQAELRKGIRVIKEEAERRTFDTFIHSQHEELIRVDLAIHAIRPGARQAFFDYLEGGKENRQAAGITTPAADLMLNVLIKEFMSLMDEQILHVTRVHHANALKEQDKRAKAQKDREKREEAQLDNPEPSIQALIEAEVRKRLNPSKQNKKNPSSSNKPKAKSNKKAPPKNGQSRKNKKPPGNSNNHAGTKKGSKQGHGSGSQGQKNKNSGNGGNSQSTKSKRK